MIIVKIRSGNLRFFFHFQSDEEQHPLFEEFDKSRPVPFCLYLCNRKKKGTWVVPLILKFAKSNATLCPQMKEMLSEEFTENLKSGPKNPNTLSHLARLKTVQQIRPKLQRDAVFKELPKFAPCIRKIIRFHDIQ